MNKVLPIAAILEYATGLALIFVPTMVGEALLGQKRPCDAKFFFEDALDKTRKKSVKNNARRRIDEINKQSKCK